MAKPAYHYKKKSILNYFNNHREKWNAYIREYNLKKGKIKKHRELKNPKDEISYYKKQIQKYKSLIKYWTAKLNNYGK